MVSARTISKSVLFLSDSCISELFHSLEHDSMILQNILPSIDSKVIPHKLLQSVRSPDLGSFTWDVLMEYI